MWPHLHTFKPNRPTKCDRRFCVVSRASSSKHNSRRAEPTKPQGGRHRRGRPEHLIATIGPSGLITIASVATSSQWTQCMRTAIALLLLRGFLVSLAAFALAGCGRESLSVPQPDAAKLSFAVSPGACWENPPQDCTIEQHGLTGGCLICHHECGCAVRDRASYVRECASCHAH